MKKILTSVIALVFALTVTGFTADAEKSAPKKDDKKAVYKADVKKDDKKAKKTKTIKGC